MNMDLLNREIRVIKEESEKIAQEYRVAKEIFTKYKRFKTLIGRKSSSIMNIEELINNIINTNLIEILLEENRWKPREK